jgi:signal transduction histidine kinase
VIPTLPDLLQQAGRLRFADAAAEKRYENDRFAAAVMQERVTMACCALVTTGLGLYEAWFTSMYRFEGLVMFLHVVRLHVVMPMWLGLFLLTFWRGFPQWMNAANATVTTLSCWGHSVMVWRTARANPNLDLVNALTGATILVLIVAIFTLPMRFRSLVLTVLLSVAGPIVFFYVTLGAAGGHTYNLRTSAASLALVGALIIMGGWFREKADRRLFAQREHARALADELALANTELARINAEKNEFMAIAAHDLRAPLATVRGLLELMADGRIATEPERNRAVRVMHEQSERMLALVTDYLSVHAAENGGIPVRLARLDLSAVAIAARDRHVPLARTKAQHLEAHEPPQPIWVTADGGLLHQIADNFVTNALKFSPPSAGVRIEVQVAEVVRRARLVVIDSGPGISAIDQARLFRKFGRAGTRPTGGEPSTGLGLAVTKRLAEAMGGQVGCASRAGAGATFWVEVALAD